MLPMHRLSSIRRLRFYLHLERHPTLNARTRGDWEDIWTFFSRTLSGPTLLRVDLGMDRAVVRRIANENEDDAGWLLPVAQCVRSAWHEGVHGNGQAIQHRTIFVRIPHSYEANGLVSVNEARQQAMERLEHGHDATELDVATCRSVHKRVQNSIRSCLQLYGSHN